MRVAIVTDSNSGITQEQAKKAGVHVVPMPFIMDGKTYHEGVELTLDQFFDKQRSGADISTSQPAPANLLDLWNQLLEEYDQIVHIPMSSGLSSSYETALMLSDDYDGRVIVVNNQRISVTLRESVLEARALADKGLSGSEIAEYLDNTKMEATIYVTVDTLEYLKKGGRITPAAALLGTFLKIKPVLTIQGEKLDAFAKARTMKQAKSVMVTAAKKDMEERFHDPEAAHTKIFVVHSNNEAAALEFREELKSMFPKTGDIYIDHLSMSVACHTGPGALAIACTRMPEA